MQLIYYRANAMNFGDELNGLLWPALMPEFFQGRPDTGFVGIGTIIGRPCGSVYKLHVFSSGVGNDSLENWSQKNVTYWCVRGPISAEALRLSADCAITDGAILVPCVAGFPKAATGLGRTVIIPHFQTLDYPGWPDVARLTGFELLDPRGDPRTIIEKIANAKLVLCESLHGAILADSYGIPWLAFATSGNFNIPKWVDWALSMGLELKLTMIPPPNAGPLLAFGRTPAKFGMTMQCSAAKAMSVFKRSGDQVPGSFLSDLKGVIKHPSFAPLFVNFNPFRTAEALRQLSNQEPQVSLDGIRERLRDRMQSRLSQLIAHTR